MCIRDSIDTAGRLHNKQNLMNELNKISRVVDRELPGCDRETLLVLDATTGQNGLIQAKQFKEAADVYKRQSPACAGPDSTPQTRR